MSSYKDYIDLLRCIFKNFDNEFDYFKLSYYNEYKSYLRYVRRYEHRVKVKSYQHRRQNCM